MIETILKISVVLWYLAGLGVSFILFFWAIKDLEHVYREAIILVFSPINMFVGIFASLNLYIMLVVVLICFLKIFIVFFFQEKLRSYWDKELERQLVKKKGL